MARALTTIGLLGMLSVAGALFIVEHGKLRPNTRAGQRVSTLVDR